MKETFRDRYVLILVVILLLAFATRLPGLGDRVMSHDEINHVYFAWLFSENGGYQHDPLSHGPLQFHLLALSYQILGDTDFTSRLPAALSGVLAIFLIWPLRRWIGRKGALAAAGLMLVSPYMLYYSRYARNESFVVVEALLTIWAVFRYLETRENKWLFLLAAALALHYTTKETAFLYTAQLLLFLLVLFVIRVLRTTWSKSSLKTTFGIGLGAAAIGLGLGMATFLRDRATVVEVAVPYISPLIFIFSAVGLIGVALTVAALILGVGRRLREDFPSLDLLILTGTFTLPQLGALPAQIMGLDPLAYSDSSQLIRTAAIVIALLILSSAAGLAWKPRTWLTAAGVFALIYVPLYTTLFSRPNGLFSGLVGSMGYWLVQQGVERGSQPWYYYALLQIPMYEYLPALGVLAAGGIALGKRFRQSSKSN
ncbi:MAG TPA: flippase activity-associated protein Agl23, partial [Anaerolineales bacterium]|nr:flippase activity-associated protein Agl23 [Anaerolineales bacterium]